MSSIPFPCPICGTQLDGLDEDIDEPGIFVCSECEWEGKQPPDTIAEAIAGESL